LSHVPARRCEWRARRIDLKRFDQSPPADSKPPVSHRLHLPATITMVKKAPLRTAERILEVTLDLFNRFGEPNVSTTLISSELSISPGNLYYHYPAKDELINSLFDRYERSLSELLNASDSVRDVEDAWFFLHTLFELIWQYRFLYRDLNDLLSKNRRLETHFQWVLKNKTRSIRAMLDAMSRHGVVHIDSREMDATSTSMVVLLTYWLSYEYVRDPRRALEPESAQRALMRGAHHVLNILVPYLEPAQRQHLMSLVSAYSQAPD
jgi:AcrR family transcriptional regulator